ASWVAVIVPPNQMPEVLEQFPRALAELSRHVRLSEFHFADIYARRKEVRGVSIDVRLGIFEFMAHVFREYRFEVFVQTLDPHYLGDLRRRWTRAERVGPFDLRRPTDTALFLLLVKLGAHLQAKEPRHPAHVFVDEGFLKNGKAVKLRV